MPGTGMESSRAMKTGKLQQIWNGNVKGVISELCPSEEDTIIKRWKFGMRKPSNK
jgi:hypothetical protein